MNRIKVKIEGGREYDILVGYHILNKIGQHIASLKLGNTVFLITSPSIGKLYLQPLTEGLNKAGLKNIIVHRVPDGEKYKNFLSYKKLLDDITKVGQNEEKKIFIINLGGGVVGDLGGYVAATYKRGINYVQIPTTLLAFVDCGIGGKVGINYRTVKNIVGAFHQPRLVFADLSLLKTLSTRELKSGLAEVVKYGVISSPQLFNFTEKNIDKIVKLDKKVIEKIAMDCYTIKADIVSQDEFDTKGIRVKLNFGHTIGHAVETASQYAYRHGEAVSIGMVCANDIAVELGLLEQSNAARVENLLRKIGLPVNIKNHNLKNIMDYLRRDKKFINGKNRFVLATTIGKVKIKEDIPAKIISDVIENRFI